MDITLLVLFAWCFSIIFLVLLIMAFVNSGHVFILLLFHQLFEASTDTLWWSLGRQAEARALRPFYFCKPTTRSSWNECIFVSLIKRRERLSKSLTLFLVKTFDRFIYPGKSNGRNYRKPKILDEKRITVFMAVIVVSFFSTWSNEVYFRVCT